MGIHNLLITPIWDRCKGADFERAHNRLFKKRSIMSFAFPPELVFHKYRSGFGRLDASKRKVWAHVQKTSSSTVANLHQNTSSEIRSSTLAKPLFFLVLLVNTCRVRIGLAWEVKVRYRAITIHLHSRANRFIYLWCFVFFYKHILLRVSLLRRQ